MSMNADLPTDSFTVAFSVTSERVCCLWIYIVCRNYFHNTTYIRGFDAFWLIMGKLVSFRLGVSSVKALNRRRWNPATFQSHTAFPQGLYWAILKMEAASSSEASIISSLPVVISQKIFIGNTTVKTSSRRPVFAECCNGHVVDVHYSWFSIIGCQI